MCIFLYATSVSQQEQPSLDFSVTQKSIETMINRLIIILIGLLIAVQTQGLPILFVKTYTCVSIYQQCTLYTVSTKSFNRSILYHNRQWTRICSSYVEQNTGYVFNRTVTLQYPGCIDAGRIMHELLHALGFLHQQSRSDRDTFVNINYNNIVPGYEGNFQKYRGDQEDALNIQYDYGSVMHYPRDAFSKNGQTTIEPLQSNVTIGQRITLSANDIQEVRNFYNCTGTDHTLPTTTTTSTSTTTTTKTDGKYIHYLARTADASYYYKLLKVTVTTNGYYNFRTDSSIDTYGYLYQKHFNAQSTLENLVVYNDDAGGKLLFLLSYNIQSGITYYLVTTTYFPLITGLLTVVISGPAEVNITLINAPLPINSTATPASIRRLRRFRSNNQAICLIVPIDPIDRTLNGESFSVNKLFFNLGHSTTANGYVRTVTIQYTQGHSPSSKTLIWIYAILPVAGIFTDHRHVDVHFAFHLLNCPQYVKVTPYIPRGNRFHSREIVGAIFVVNRWFHRSEWLIDSDPFSRGSQYYHHMWYTLL
ncbi:unnamed protein product [Rotaria magnacalcarata]